MAQACGCCLAGAGATALVDAARRRRIRCSAGGEAPLLRSFSIVYEKSHHAWLVLLRGRRRGRHTGGCRWQWANLPRRR